MAKRNKTCALCGTLYQYCNTCREDMYLPTWMNTFCSQECLDVYEAMTSYVNGHSSKEAAKAILMTYRESGKYKNYKKSFATTYDKIMAENQTEIEKEAVEKTNPEEVINQIAADTASQVKLNITAEAKKVYPNAVAHKHGK